MASDLQALARVLEASLDPTKNKQAERIISEEEKKPGFSVSLLQIVATENGGVARLASALYFKNFIRRNWTDEDGNHKLSQDEVITIKAELIGLMISVPPNIQHQLGDAIGIIADSDFWERWDTLVDDLVSRLTPDNPVINNGVLQVAHSIFKRWRPLYRTDALFTEINHVLGKFSTPFLTLFERTDSLIERNQSNKEFLPQVFATLNLIIKLFYDLSVQDLPPAFEDNLAGITVLLHKYLTYENPLLNTNEDTEVGQLELVKSGILEVLSLYVQKYEDVFGVHVEPFVKSTWNLLTAVGMETKYDILVSKALQFLTSVTRISKHAQSFNDEPIIGQVVERVILPNLALRDSDVELFEDEPIEFIRRDLEGSDNDTRRKAATDFLRQLLSEFEKMVAKIVFRYIDHYLVESSSDAKANWKSKDTAVYLYSSIAIKGTVTASQGVKSINDFVNILDFFQKNIAKDLVSDTGVEPILKVDAIKYLHTFRSQMSQALWHEAFPLLVKHLESSNFVVYSYSAIAIERAIALSNDSNEPMIDRGLVLAQAGELLNRLFRLIEQNPQSAKLQENEFLMRCVMRVLIVIREGVRSMADFVLAHLIKIIQIIQENPSNPRFYYYLFEALGALIRFGTRSEPGKLETDLYSPFAAILQNDVQEFMPYVFQLFAALLEANPSETLSEYYQTLIPPLLSPELWVSKGNVPALVRLLSSIIARGAADIDRNDQLERLLAIFSQLVSTRTNEVFGFELLECIIENFGGLRDALSQSKENLWLTSARNSLRTYWVSILQVLLTRLQTSRTDTFALRFVRLYHFISGKADEGFGADFFISVIDQVQSNVFVPLYLNIILPTTQKLIRPIDRKIAVISLTKTLTDSNAFASKYEKGWAYTCEALLKLLENPPVPSTNSDDVIADHDVDDMSFGVGFTQLSTTRPPLRDPWPTVTEVKVWVSRFLKARDKSLGGQVRTFANKRLSAEAKPLFAEYLRP